LIDETPLLTPYSNPKIKTKKKHTKANRCNDFNQKTALPIRWKPKALKPLINQPNFCVLCENYTLQTW